MPASPRILVIGDLEATRLVCTLLGEEGAHPLHLLAPGEDDLTLALSEPVDGVAVVVRGDVLALRYVLLVAHLAPGVPVVATIFDRTLGRQLASVVAHCTVTSPADVAAPSIAAACVLPGALALLPPGDGAGTAARAVCDVDGAAVVQPYAPARRGVRNRLSRWVPRRYGGAEGLLMAGLLGLVAIIGAEWVLAAAVLHEGALEGLYSAVRLAATVGPADAVAHGAPGWYLVIASLLMFAGIGFTGALVAGLVEWVTGQRTAALVGPRRVPTADHVVVAGLGQVGLRVAQLLRELDVPVVVVERLPRAANLPMARADRIPVVVGDASNRSTLLRVGLHRARAVAALGSEDLDNVAVVINASAVAPGVRTVLRAGEDRAVQETTSLFRIGSVGDVGAMTAVWVCSSVRGSTPVVAYAAGGLVGALTAEGDRRRPAPARCRCGLYTPRGID